MHHRPASEQDVCGIVRMAANDATPLRLVGGNSRRAYGRDVAASATLDLSALTGVTIYQPDELVLTARPGTPMAEIETLLQSRGQYLAFEPPDFGPLWGGAAKQGTLGGMLAMGLGGPRRPFMGAPRDHFLGFRAVNGFGEAFVGGGRVVKNVTGFDLPKLLAGSMGTLAALTEVTLKVLPAPAAVETLLLHGLNDAEAVAAMSAAMNGAAQVTGAAHLPANIASSFPGLSSAGASVTLLRLEGVAAALKGRRDNLRAALTGWARETAVLDDAASRALWRAIADLSPFTGDTTRPVWRVSLPPTYAARVAERIRGQIGIRYFYDWGGGALWIETANDAPEQARVIRGALADIAGDDGHAGLLRAPETLRARVSPLHPLPPALLALTRRIKAQFDPAGILNPGRLYQEF